MPGAGAPCRWSVPPDFGSHSCSQKGLDSCIGVRSSRFRIRQLGVIYWIPTARGFKLRREAYVGRTQGFVGWKAGLPRQWPSFRKWIQAFETGSLRSELCPVGHGPEVSEVEIRGGHHSQGRDGCAATAVQPPTKRRLTRPSLVRAIREANRV